MEKKICSKCKIEKNICEYRKDSTKKDGLYSSCKECTKFFGKKFSMDYYIKNRQDLLKKRKEFKEKNPNIIKKYYLTYKEKNPEKLKESSKKYKEKNYEKIIQYKKNHYRNNIESHIKYRKENYKKRNEYEKNRKTIDPTYKLISNMRSRMNRFFKLKNITKKNKTFEIVGCSPEQLREHIEKQFKDGMCWEKMGKYIHIDHIIPLASAKTEEEILKLCHYTNLQPLWAEDNLKKRDKIIHHKEIFQVPDISFEIFS